RPDAAPAHGEEVADDDLADGAPAVHAAAQAEADDGLLRDRRVATATVAEALLQPHRRLEDAAGRAHVLADEIDGRVALHLLRDSPADRLPERQFRHDEPPSA